VTEQAQTCGRCDRQVLEAPFTWSLQVLDGVRVWLCEVCTRRDVRSFECRLDEQWW